MSEPIKHAPGVVCIIQIRTALNPPNELSLRARTLLNGRTCTIVGPAPPYYYADDGTKVTSNSYRKGRVCWLVRAESPLPVATSGSKGETLRYSRQRVFAQMNLIPIAGPGIDVDETTTIETPVPAQSPVPETT